MSDDKFSQAKPFDALNSRGLIGKREYVRGLELRRDEEALSLLVECLCDESWYLRDQAEEALTRIGPSVASVLLPLLEQGLWFTRTSSARVLGRFGHRPAVPGLLRLADDANETVADAARDALVAVGRGGGTISIARALHGPEEDVRVEVLLDRPPLFWNRIRIEGGFLGTEGPVGFVFFHYRQ
jgi:HEAT repeat protein